MKFLNKFKQIFSKSSTVTIRDVELTNSECGADYGWPDRSDESFDVGPWAAYCYLAKIGALRTAGEMISDAICALTLGVQDDSERNKINLKHPILGILREPGPEFIIPTDLIRGLVESYLLTNEAWLILRGNVTREPIALSYVRPYNVSEVSVPQSNDPLPQRYQTDARRDSRIYNLQIINNAPHYIDESGLNELCPIFGTRDLIDESRALSSLTSIKQELEHIWHGNLHNTSLLKKGLTINTMFWPKERMPVAEQNKLVEVVQKQLAGSRSGGVFFAPAQLEKADLSYKNKDADYTSLSRDSRNSVYTIFDIPLPLVSPEHMTLDNYETAQEALYDNAINRQFSSLFLGISIYLCRRFKISPAVKIVYNQFDVKALQTRQVEKMESLRSSQALGTNEIRATAGYGKPSPDDPVLVGANLVPQGSESGFEEPDEIEENELPDKFSTLLNTFKSISEGINADIAEDESRSEPADSDKE